MPKRLIGFFVSKNRGTSAKLRKACSMLNLPPDVTTDHLKNEPLEVALFTQEIECHTDIYRGDWIDQYQKSYCVKHPEDLRSCKMKKQDLCDMNQILALPQEKRLKFYKQQICDMFPHAHETVKSHAVYQKIFTSTCPQNKKRHTEL